MKTLACLALLVVIQVVGLDTVVWCLNSLDASLKDAYHRLEPVLHEGAPARAAR